MPRTDAQLSAEVEAWIQEGFNGRLVTRGQAQSMIRRSGQLPVDAPAFSSDLDYDLLSFGFGLLEASIRVGEFGDDGTASEAYQRASEALEFAVRHAEPSERDEFYRLVAGAASHMGGYAARAFSLVAPLATSATLNECEATLRDVLLRELGSAEDRVRRFNASGVASDDSLLAAFSHDGEEALAFDPTQLLVTSSFLAAAATGLFALRVGDGRMLSSAIDQIDYGMAVAADVGYASMWWVHRLAKHLLTDLSATSIRSQIPVDLGTQVRDDWLEFREMFIASLFHRDRAHVDLWPPQLKVAEDVFLSRKDLVLSLPTSAGKTRIAELAVLACLAERRRALYITPLRALSAQAEQSFRETFGPLGASVSALYGSMGTTTDDADALRLSDIAIATPEKLDFALRNDPSLIDDVGLVVLDEGHMVGPDEREVRYEAQIQKLLSRADAESRRILCLSAVLAEGEELNDFVGWLSDDEPRGLVKNDWRPTRLQFGVVEWANGAAKMQINVGDQTPFVPRFLSAEPGLGLRRNPFPNSQTELVLATTWRLVDDGQSVLIYSPQKVGVVKLAREIVELSARGHLRDLPRPTEQEIQRALEVGGEWYSPEHDFLKCLRLGVAIHHGSLPTAYRKEVEVLLRRGELKVAVASPTLAQGLNLSASAVVFSGLHRSGTPISGPEFRNVVGRAGRAYVDAEGLVLFPMFDNRAGRVSNWERLVEDRTGTSLVSGILQLLDAVHGTLKDHLETDEIDEILAQLDGTDWSFPGANNEPVGLEAKLWNEHTARLDGAVLSAIDDFEIPDAEMIQALETSLTGSLLERQLARREDNERNALTQILQARARNLWASSTGPQRRGWFLAGLGKASGVELDQIANESFALLIRAELEIEAGAFPAATDTIVSLAALLFGTEVFAPENVGDDDDWRPYLRAWLDGEPMAQFRVGDTEVADFIENDVVYTLVWALDALRVRHTAHEEFGNVEDLVSGTVVRSVEAGTYNRPATVLLRNGLNSRLGAIAACERTGAEFMSADGMRDWLLGLPHELTEVETWPTPESRLCWTDFVQSSEEDISSPWQNVVVDCPVVVWKTEAPEEGDAMRVVVGPDGEIDLMTPAFEMLGRVAARVTGNPQGVFTSTSDGIGARIEYRGPGDPLIEMT